MRTGAPALLYLPSYDTVSEVLEYAPHAGVRRVCTPAEFDVLGVALAHGFFARERAHVVGYFATPEGPAFFHDQHLMLGTFGKLTGRIDPVGASTRRRFTLSQALVFDLVYEERHGVGTNPYDNTVEDVDLFAFIVSKLGDEAFFRQNTRPWDR